MIRIVDSVDRLTQLLRTILWLCRAISAILQSARAFHLKANQLLLSVVFARRNRGSCAWASHRKVAGQSG